MLYDYWRLQQSVGPKELKVYDCDLQSVDSSKAMVIRRTQKKMSFSDLVLR